MDESIKVLYLHGYGTRFDKDSEKMRCLAQLGAVVGPNLDYGAGPDRVRQIAVDFARQERPDVIVGTSMGGWLASHLGAALGIPFVALNPAVRPSQSLRRHIDKIVNYCGVDASIDEATVAAYEDFHKGEGLGLVLCEEEDEVLDAKATVDFLGQYYTAELLPGGSHRFESLEAELDTIRYHAQIANLMYGS